MTAAKRRESARLWRKIARKQRHCKHDIVPRAATWQWTKSGQLTRMSIEVFMVCRTPALASGARECGWVSDRQARYQIDGLTDFDAFSKQIIDQVFEQVETEKEKKVYGPL